MEFWLPAVPKRKKVKAGVKLKVTHLYGELMK